jgi:hypothetical protein
MVLYFNSSKFKIKKPRKRAECQSGLSGIATQREEKQRRVENKTSKLQGLFQIFQ